MNDRGNSGFPVGQNGGIEKVKANTLSRNCKTVYQRAKVCCSFCAGISVCRERWAGTPTHVRVFAQLSSPHCTQTPVNQGGIRLSFAVN